MSGTKIEPALTAKEWARWSLDDTDAGSPSGFGEPEKRHMLAALCLDGHPFGFSREDVELLRVTIEVAEDVTRDVPSGDRLRSLADRIEALLPPPPADQREKAG